MSKATKCKFCNSVKCKTRIVTKDFRYDELACDHHIHDIELDSDKILGTHNGILRTHISSSAPLKRGEPIDESPIVEAIRK